jgi:uncharacterized protein YndB with AHSA1/START domain
MGKDWASGGSHEVSVKASIEDVWALVSNIERFGEWSPETYRTEWLTAGPVGPGSMFRGHNRRVDGLKRWWSDCEVLELVEPRLFAFWVLRVDFEEGAGVIELPERLRTTWRYSVESASGGTSTLRVSFDCPALADPESGYRKNDRFEAIDSGARETLQRIKETAEADR